MNPLYGFTFLKDGLRHDYCFKESLLSLSKLVKKVYIALGKNDDGTQAVIESLDFVEIIPTVWDPKLMGDGGMIFSEQTNIALNAMRAAHKNEPGAWGIYLQGDELIHEKDIDQVKKDIQQADETGCDAIKFRYLHFWQNHQTIAINKIWYPWEVRGLKLDSNVESWGDAQGFKGETKFFESDVNIHHYGHVRDQEIYKEKKADIIRYIRPDEKLGKYKKREKKSHSGTKVLSYLGDHPNVMKERIKRLGDTWELPVAPDAYIVGNPSKYSDSLKKQINAQNIHWVDALGSVPKKDRKNAVLMEPSFIQKFTHQSIVPNKMDSPLAKEWPDDLKLILRLSEKGISLKRM